MSDFKPPVWSRKEIPSFPSHKAGAMTTSDTNRAVQSQKMVRCLKFQIKKEEGLYYVVKTKALISANLRIVNHNNNGSGK